MKALTESEIAEKYFEHNLQMLLDYHKELAIPTQLSMLIDAITEMTRMTIRIESGSKIPENLINFNKEKVNKIVDNF